jgi:hypothetical protein
MENDVGCDKLLTTYLRQRVHFQTENRRHRRRILSLVRRPISPLARQTIRSILQDYYVRVKVTAALPFYWIFSKH